MVVVSEVGEMLVEIASEMLVITPAVIVSRTDGVVLLYFISTCFA